LPSHCSLWQATIRTSDCYTAHTTFVLGFRRVYLNESHTTGAAFPSSSTDWLTCCYERFAGYPPPSITSSASEPRAISTGIFRLQFATAASFRRLQLIPHDAYLHIPRRRRSVADQEEQAEHGRSQATAVDRAQQQTEGRPREGTHSGQPSIKKVEINLRLGLRIIVTY